MKTHNVTCCNCNNSFPVELSQFNYQTRKNPNHRWFCTRSCLRSKCNQEKPSDAKHLQNFRKKASDAKRKYNQNFVWYVRRCKHDHRFDTPTDIFALEAILADKWAEQGGVCAVTKTPLLLKRTNGVCAVSDPWQIASVDRIDSTLPYIKGNVHWVSLAINLAKKNCEHKKFLAGFETAARNFLSNLVEEEGIEPSCRTASH